MKSASYKPYVVEPKTSTRMFSFTYANLLAKVIRLVWFKFYLVRLAMECLCFILDLSWVKRGEFLVRSSLECARNAL